MYKEAHEYFSSGKWKDYLFKYNVPKRTEIAKNQLGGKFIIDIDDPKLSRQFSGITQELLRKLEE